MMCFFFCLCTQFRTEELFQSSLNKKLKLENRLVLKRHNFKNFAEFSFHLININCIANRNTY
jgi:hypothetical protein